MLKVISHNNGTYRMAAIKLSSFPFVENSCERARRCLYAGRDYKRSRSLSVYALWLNYR